jgi:hypothetical protein
MPADRPDVTSLTTRAGRRLRAAARHVLPNLAPWRSSRDFRLQWTGSMTHSATSALTLTLPAVEAGRGSGPETIRTVGATRLNPHGERQATLRAGDHAQRHRLSSGPRPGRTRARRGGWRPTGRTWSRSGSGPARSAAWPPARPAMRSEDPCRADRVCGIHSFDGWRLTSGAGQADVGSASLFITKIRGSSWLPGTGPTGSARMVASTLTAHPVTIRRPRASGTIPLVDDDLGSAVIDGGA